MLLKVALKHQNNDLTHWAKFNWTFIYLNLAR
jgi:hypothetical protein